ncbi:MAG: hemerythrin domain-containing protein [Magnetococcales bacterium]|nr:hemerythrin domain-containing protein [Magnetococcales bacterium]
MSIITTLPEEYILGHDAIDTQHEVLFCIYKEVEHYLNVSDNAFPVEAIFNGLTHYVGTHFAYEEVLMKESGYPDRPNHEHEHATLCSHVGGVVSDYAEAEGDQEQQLAIVRELKAFLDTWLTMHISVVDRQMVEHLLKSKTE